MATVIDRETAWQLVRQARRQCCGISAPTSIPLPADDGACIVLSPDGRWDSDCVVRDSAARLLDIYLPLVVTPQRTFVAAQLGQSLDGRIATVSGDSHYVTGSEDLVHLHRLRALFDAVLVGAGTAVADNPQLTVRHVPGANPVRVVLDPRRRVPAEQRLFADDGTRSLRVVSTRTGGRPRGEEIGIEPGAAGLEPGAVLAALAQRGLRRVLVEGGGVTVSRFLEAGCLDRLHVSVAPVLIGSGRPAVILPVIDSLSDALRPMSRSFPLGRDVLFDLAPQRRAAVDSGEP